MPSSRGSSQPRDQTLVSCISALAGGFFTTSATWEAHPYLTPGSALPPAASGPLHELSVLLLHPDSPPAFPSPLGDPQTPGRSSLLPGSEGPGRPLCWAALTQPTWTVCPSYPPATSSCCTVSSGISAKNIP